MRGQVALEYLLIAGFLLFFVAILIVYYKDFTRETGARVIVDASLNNFKRVADSVYALGIPAKQVARVSIPENVDSSRTRVDGTVLQISYYNINGGLVDAVRFFDYNLSGRFPNVTGNYEVVLTALNSAGVRVDYS